MLLNENNEITTLDDAISNQINQELFTKFLDEKILSTTNTVNKSGFWIKMDNKNYSFIISKDEKINFTLENSTFKCVSDIKLCQRLY